MKKKYLLLLILGLLITGLLWLIVANTGQNKKDPKGIETADSRPTSAEEKTVSMNNKPLSLPEMEIDQNHQYLAILKTDLGEIQIELFANQTPITVNNFVSLAKNNFYDGTIFHRVISGFMIQGGDPKGDGTGGPGYRFDDESFEGKYERGVVAMANAGPSTNGSQFFIMHQDYDLPPNYVIFGKVVRGMETVDKIANAPTQASPGGEKSRPVNPVKVEKVEIIENQP